MANIEDSSRFELPASQGKLANLFLASSVWLRSNCALYMDAPGLVPAWDDSQATHPEDDLLISEGMPRHEIDIPAQLIHSFVPNAAQFVRVESGLGITYYLPHYSQPTEHEVGDALYFNPPRLEFEIGLLDPVIKSETISIEARDKNITQIELVTDKYTEKYPVSDHDEEADTVHNGLAEVIRDAEVHNLDTKMGKTKMTNREHAALSRIVDGLDIFRTLMEYTNNVN